MTGPGAIRPRKIQGQRPWTGRGSDYLTPDPSAAIAARTAEVLGPTDERRSADLDFVVKVLGKCEFCAATLTDALLAEHPGVCGTCFKRGRRSTRANPLPEARPAKLCPCGCLAPLGQCAEKARAEERRRVEEAEQLEFKRRRARHATGPGKAGPSPQPVAGVVALQPSPAAVAAPPCTVVHQPAPPGDTMPKPDPKRCEACGKKIRAKNGKITQPCFKCRRKKVGPAAAAPAREEAQPRPPRREKRGRATFGVLDEFAELEGRAKDRLSEIDVEVRAHQEQIQKLNDEAQQLRQRLGMERPASASARAVG